MSNNKFSHVLEELESQFHSIHTKIGKARDKEWEKKIKAEEAAKTKRKAARKRKVTAKAEVVTQKSEP